MVLCPLWWVHSLLQQTPQPPVVLSGQSDRVQVQLISACSPVLGGSGLGETYILHLSRFQWWKFLLRNSAPLIQIGLHPQGQHKMSQRHFTRNSRIQVKVGEMTSDLRICRTRHTDRHLVGMRMTDICSFSCTSPRTRAVRHLINWPVVKGISGHVTQVSTHALSR